MTKQREIHLRQIASELVSDGGILALDEKPKTFEKKLNLLKIQNTKENRYLIRSKILKTPNLQKIIKGVILHEETFNQKIDKITIPEYLIKKNIHVGIKVDRGLKTTPSNEFETEGFEQLDAFIKNPIFKYASFTKWRSVFKISDLNPTLEIIEKNCIIMAKYAKLIQKHGMVPIIEPEILWDGDYTLNKSIYVTKKILSHLIFHLNLEKVIIPATLIKIAFVTLGKELGPIDVSKCAVSTLQVIESSLPIGLAGIVFLSGGHGNEDSLKFLNKTCSENTRKENKLSFSFGRAITDGVLKLFKEEASDEEIFKHIQDVLHNLELALQGKLLN